MSDSDATGAGAVGQESPASDSQQDATSPEYVTKESLQEFGNELIGRLKQSQGDILTDRVEKTVPAAVDEAFRARLTPHLKEGTDLGAIEREAQVDVLLSQSFPSEQDAGESPQAEPASPASEPSPLDVEIDRILKGHGVERDNPQIKEYLETKEGTLTELLVGLDDTAEKAKASQPGASGVISPGGKAATPDLIQDYVNEMAANKGKGSSVRRDIRNKFKRLGVDVDKIGFGGVGQISFKNENLEELPSATYEVRP